MAGPIKGIDIAISADTSGVTKGLKEVSSESMKTSKNLKTVESLLKLDPHNTELVAQKQRLLAQNIEQTKDKLAKLKAAQDDVRAAFERGEISEEQYISFQGEIVKTESRLKQLEGQVDDTGTAMETAGSKTDSFGSKLKDGLGAAAKAAGVAIAAVGTAVVAGTKALADMTISGAEYADSILTQSQVTGIATDKLQEYQYAAELIDVSTDTLTKSMAKNIKSMASAADGTGATADAYKKLGVQVTNSDGSLRDSQEVYWELIDALGDVENETDRDALAMQILGKSAQELNPLIEAGSDRMAELGQQAHDAGAVLSDDALDRFGAFDDQLQYLKANSEAAKNALGTALLPMLTNLAGTGNDLLTDFTKSLVDANGDIGKMADAVAEIIPQIVDAIVAALPQILDAATKIGNSLSQGLLDNLPQIVSVAGDIILQLASALVDMLPEIVATGLQVIAELAIGIANALPTLIPTIVDVVLQIVDTLLDNIDLLIDAAIQLMIGLAQGLITAIPRIIEKVPVIISKLLTAILNNLPKLLDAGVQLIKMLAQGIVNTLGSVGTAAGQIVSTIWNTIKELPKKALEWGKDIIQGLVNGIKSKISAITGAVSGVAGKIKSFLHFSVPDEGPLTDYQTWMPDFMEGLAKGIRNSMGIVKGAVSELSQAMVPDMSGALAQYGRSSLVLAQNRQAAAPAYHSAQGYGNSFNITVNVQQMSNDYDARRAAEVMAQALEQLTTDNSSMRGAWSV